MKRVKRIPSKIGPITKSDVYVKSNSIVTAQLRRLKKLVDFAAVGEIAAVVHGLGKAVKKAVVLSLKLKRDLHGLGLDISFLVQTGTQTLLDDITLEDDLDNDSQVECRLNSSIHIQIIKN